MPDAILIKTSNNWDVIYLDNPQVWTLIGVFSAAIFALIGVVFASFRMIGTGLRAEMASMRNELGARMDARFDHLDHDFQLLMTKEFGDR